VDLSDSGRRKADFVVRSGGGDRESQAEVAVDATQWHNWAVEWIPMRVIAHLDGRPWYTATPTSAFASGPVHLVLRLDWLPTGTDAVRPSTMSVAWVRSYATPGSTTDAAIVSSTDAASVTGAGVITTDSSGVAGATGSATVTGTGTEAGG
jgi:hypothetical protein